MRRAIATDFAVVSPYGFRVVVTLDSRLPAEPGPWQVERIGPDECRDRLRSLAAAADFTVLIAPETSGILASLTRELSDRGARILGSTADAVELTADKSRLAARLAERAIDTPATVIVAPRGGLPGDTVYPAVLKPVDGAGSVDTFYLVDEQSLHPEALALPMAVLQPFIPGTPMSASFLVGAGGEAWLIGMGMQRMETRDGRFHYLGGSLPVVCPEAVPELMRAVGSVRGLCGFVGVDFVWNAAERHAVILEINPRPTTSYVGLARLLPEGLLARAWLMACGAMTPQAEMLEGLAQHVAAQAPVSFRADGALIVE
jgi:predicted ATP-grasp superfamily ATP-dependent carboligase